MGKTVIALFNNTAEAQKAVRALLNSGIAREDIGITSNDYTTGGGATTGNAASTGASNTDEGIGEKISNFFSSLFGGADTEQSGYYTNAVHRGGTVVTVDAETEEAATRAASLLEQYGAADVNEQGAQMSAGNYTNASATATDVSTRTQEMTDRSNLKEGGEVTLPVVQEELQVGKREVERGGVRVRSHIVETPVEESVRLREERVRVERRPVNRAVDEHYLNAFQEGTIEVTESKEVPVISKQARVVEEVVVNKEVAERSETVHDTVRRSDVEVEQLDTNVTGTDAKGTTSR